MLRHEASTKADAQGCEAFMQVAAVGGGLGGSGAARAIVVQFVALSLAEHVS